MCTSKKSAETQLFYYLKSILCVNPSPPLVIAKPQLLIQRRVYDIRLKVVILNKCDVKKLIIAKYLDSFLYRVFDRKCVFI